MLIIKILALSDTHGILPDLELEGIDLVLYAGDFSARHRDNIYQQLSDFENFVCPWMREIARKTRFYWIAGNHEVFMERIPNYTNDVIENYCLNNRSILISDLDILIHGIPQTNRFCDWAYNEDDTPEGMGFYCGEIPDKTTILLSHGPPFGILDVVPGRIGIDRYTGDYVEVKEQHVGSKELLKRINEIKNPLTIFGHIHSGYGILTKENQTFVNCSILDKKYESNKPVLLEFEKKGKYLIWK